MPVQENISDILKEYDHIDYGILALTNPYRYPNDIASDSGEIAFLTEKDVYRWLPLIADVVQDTSTSRLLEECIGEIVKTALRKVGSTSGISERTNATSTTILNFRGAETSPYGLSDLALGRDLHLPAHIAKLEDRGYIADPLIEAVSGIQLLVLALVPVSFTKRTESGDELYLKISTLLWDIEFKKSTKEISYNLHIRMKRAVDVFKKTVKNLAAEEDLARQRGREGDKAVDPDQ